MLLFAVLIRTRYDKVGVDNMKIGIPKEIKNNENQGGGWCIMHPRT